MAVCRLWDRIVLDGLGGAMEQQKNALSNERRWDAPHVLPKMMCVCLGKTLGVFQGLVLVPGAGCWVLGGAWWDSWTGIVEGTRGSGFGPPPRSAIRELRPRLTSRRHLGSLVPVTGQWAQLAQRGPTLFRWCRGSGCYRAQCTYLGT
ncbi:uncharacterized protein BDZ83DRAFT_651424 [Colletotrichum acutatum]|uniref:Uncharacterized protein n=1 Tax=Glomerella acutata TaxID=27357 RepID=A0AAD8UK52_GLOAC|nr:uncharacterized protein BDZ83DRAFT_651424 [Colletotrichum acutatum]KAK1725406.1 hypothetical protein BDZ83DRAFT_651424 [Colletotrichum acutatum]